MNKIKEWLFALGKTLAVRTLEKERGVVKEKLATIAITEGSAGVDKAVDALQEKLKSAVNKLPLIPPYCKDELKDFIQEKGDSAQAQIAEAIKEGSWAAISKVVDLVFDAVLEKIKNIKL